MARALTMQASSPTAQAWAAAQRRDGARLVLAHGYFNPPDAGDVAYLSAAAAHGQRLLVLVQDDASWTEARARSELISALRGVDVVIPHGIGMLGIEQVLTWLNPHVFVARPTWPAMDELVRWASPRGIEVVVERAAAGQPEAR
ncbi:MAG: hypothetical protein SF182_01505 [Deltaproteobacteria bacterium]|nr:hypothetical protein [Deltaproteobacteria bacterium]